jgi:hypothetical protein
VIERYRRRKVRVLLCGIHPELHEPLRAAGVLDVVEEGDICSDLHEVAARVGTGEF